jgi:hypothetical protein
MGEKENGVMKKEILIVGMLLLMLPLVAQTSVKSDQGVSMVNDTANQRVDIYIGGNIFTSFIYPSTLDKPVLYPIYSASGVIISRGFPLMPRPGERVDHPHQVGCWFNYGNVNGLDFWNNSYAIPDSEKSHYGSIRDVKVTKAEGGKDKGTLIFQCKWVDHAGQVVLCEETSMVFAGDAHYRTMGRTTRLTAPGEPVRFGDNKEGLFALRVDRAFESPNESPEIYTDAAGNATIVPVINNEGVNGVYRSSEGKEKDAVWGTRASWVSLTAKKENGEISICIFDHPANPGYPGCWHARGYGLFAVNDIGRKAYHAAEPENTLHLDPGKTIVFRHMLLIKSGSAITDTETTRRFNEFATN